MKKLHKMVATTGLITLLATPIKGIDTDQDLRKQLSRAILDNNMNKITSLLTDEPYLAQMPNDFGNKPMQEVIFTPYEPLIPLLASLTDPDEVNTDGLRPIHIAIMLESSPYTKLRALKGAGADINAADIINGSTAMHHAAWQEKTDLIELLAKIGADPNIGNKKGMTPLFVSVSKDQDSMIKPLIQAGAKQIPDASGWTPLHAAAYNNNPLIIEELLRYEPTETFELLASSIKNDPTTPLHIAVSYRKIDAALKLAEYIDRHPMKKFLLTIKDMNNETPYQLLQSPFWKDAIKEKEDELAQTIGPDKARQKIKMTNDYLESVLRP